MREEIKNLFFKRNQDIERSFLEEIDMDALKKRIKKDQFWKKD